MSDSQVPTNPPAVRPDGQLRHLIVRRHSGGAITTIPLALNEFSRAVQAALDLINEAAPPASLQPSADESQVIDGIVPLLDARQPLNSWTQLRAPNPRVSLTRADADSSPPRPVELLKAAHERMHDLSPQERATVAAARAIFEAHQVFATRCISILAEKETSAAAAIESYSAGDSILRLAALAFCKIKYGCDSVYHVKKLEKMAANFGTGNAEGSHAHSRSSRLVPELSPRAVPPAVPPAVAHATAFGRPC
jgi:hypothetical protein